MTEHLKPTPQRKQRDWQTKYEEIKKFVADSDRRIAAIRETDEKARKKSIPPLTIGSLSEAEQRSA